MSRTDLVVATGRTGRRTADGPAPHVSRVLDYLSGGSDYSGPDKELAVQLLGVSPRLREEVRAHRRHTTRVVKWLAREGYTQFLDLGCGWPYDPGQDEVLHAHDAARTVHERVSTVYVDNFGPAHSRAEMSLTNDPGAAAVRADACDVAALLAGAPVRARFDMKRPIAALAHGLLEWQDDHQALDLVNGLHAHLPPGSAVSVTHTATSTQDERSVLAERYVYAASGIAYHPRSAGHIRALLGRWTVQSPGVVPTGLWGSGYGEFAQRLPDNAHDLRASYAAVALKSA
ncbi:SAM-dependent methyltransferase [Streptomyces griseobrunneus]